MKHLIGTASAAGVAFGLALFASTAYANETAPSKSASDPGTSSSYNSNSQNTSYTVPVSNSLNDNSTHNKDSYNSTSVPLNDVANDQSTRDSNNDNSQKNDNSQGSHNDQSQHFDQSEHFDQSSGRNDNSLHNSDNTSLKVGDVSLAMSSADLDGNVSNQTFNASGANGGMSSGALSFSGNAMQGYSGITNANYVTGQGSLGQAANSVTATSSISFR